MKMKAKKNVLSVFGIRDYDILFYINLKQASKTKYCLSPVDTSSWHVHVLIPFSMPTVHFIDLVKALVTVCPSVFRRLKKDGI